MATHFRPYRAGADLDAVLAVRRACTRPGQAGEYPSLADLRVLLDAPLVETSRNTALWEDETGQVRGFAAVVLPAGNLIYDLLPGARGAVEAEMIAWAVARMRAVVAAGGTYTTLDAVVSGSDGERRALLERHGFVLQAEQTLQMSRSLAEPIPVPELPPGCLLRPLNGTTEVPAYVALHREAFGTTNLTIERRLAWMREANYVPELDLLAAAPDGPPAAFCVCFIDQEANRQAGRTEGEIGTIGVRPAFRGQGLGRAMLLAGLQGLRAHGLDTAVLGTSTTNTSALRLYEVAGFRTMKRFLCYCKDL
jgi:mycothiol synthase